MESKKAEEASAIFTAVSSQCSLCHCCFIVSGFRVLGSINPASLRPPSCFFCDLNYANERGFRRPSADFVLQGLRSVVSIEAVEKRIQRRDRLHDLTRICRAPMPAAGSRARALPGNPLLLQEYPPDHTQITEPSSAPF